MPDQIELKPDSYSVTDATGRKYKRDDPRAMWITVAIAMAALGVIWLNRDQMHSQTLFLVTSLFAAGVGGGLATIFKNFR